MIKNMNWVNKIKLLTIALTLTASISLKAENSSKATVVKIRGKVVAHIEGQKVNLKKGDKISAKTKIESEAKSFAVITFEDKTKLTLGPKSTIIVVNPSTDKNPGIINLLQGQIRSKITKPGKMNKYFVNSKAAAIGVRGTEFIAIYNEKTNSLTTGGFSVLVAIGPAIKGELTVESVSNSINRAGDKVYMLKAKHFSSVQKVGDKIKVSAPRKLNPIQYNQLKNNSVPTFSKKSIIKKNNEKKRSSNLPNISNALSTTSIVPKKTDLNADSSMPQNKLGGNNQMPAGSFVDLNTGTIIPPPPGSDFDSNSGTFISDGNLGSVSDDGSYIPPEGMQVNMDGKFVVDEGASKQAQENAMAKVVEVNQVIEKSTNKESIFINPTSKAIFALDSTESNEEENQDNAQGESPRAIASNDKNDMTLETMEMDPNEKEELSDESSTVDVSNSCPGNICDRFDTVAPTSDEASKNTLVQFNIRVNNK